MVDEGFVGWLVGKFDDRIIRIKLEFPDLIFDLSFDHD
jgi:hypothetical protein